MSRAYKSPISRHVIHRTLMHLKKGVVNI